MGRGEAITKVEQCEFGPTLTATAAAANAGGAGSGDGGRRAGAVPDALVEVPVGVGEGRVGGDDAVDGAAAQLAVVLRVPRHLAAESEGKSGSESSTLAL